MKIGQVVELRDETENTFSQSLKTLLFRQYWCAQRIRGSLRQCAIYRKNSSVIRTIFTKKRGLVAGVRVIHVN